MIVTTLAVQYLEDGPAITALLGREQITADLYAVRDAGSDGLVLWWYAWHIPLECLNLV